MEKPQLERIVSQVQHLCSNTGARLTDKRKRVLEILLQSDKPLSAYEINGIYNKTAAVSMHTMSFYRILEFLESEGLVHKIQSANKFMACSHINKNRVHDVPQFLVCKSCNRVSEVLMSADMVEQLKTVIKDFGYKLNNSQLELLCVCNCCPEEFLKAD